VWGGARGWNTDQFGRHRLPLLVRPLGVWNVVTGEGRFVGTLLGPEGAGRSGEPDGDVNSDGADRLSYRRASRGGLRVWRWRVIGDWSYVENCTVDASIF
jgi:hypothetical protein